jgi:hypothetical protein
MSARIVHLEHLVGCVVRDRDGKAVGRIEEMRTEERDGELVIMEYHLGSHAFWERIGLSFVKLAGVSVAAPRKVQWHQLDLSDPVHPVWRA